MSHLCLLSIQRQSFVPLGQITLPSLPCCLPFLPHPLSPVFVSYSLPFVPLGQINLLCAENLVLGVLSQL